MFRPRLLTCLSIAFCLLLLNFAAAQPAGTMVLSFVVTDSRCQTPGGTILVNVSGGTAPYTYSFNGGPFQSSALYIGEGDADHPVAVKDATGQVVNAIVHINNNYSMPVVFDGVSIPRRIARHLMER